MSTLLPTMLAVPQDLLAICIGKVSAFILLSLLMTTCVRINWVNAKGHPCFLNGLTASVVGRHPIASNWVLIELDPNQRTQERRWAILEDALQQIPAVKSATAA